jgi:hypothetical protein
MSAQSIRLGADTTGVFPVSALFLLLLLTLLGAIAHAAFA